MIKRGLLLSFLILIISFSFAPRTNSALESSADVSKLSFTISNLISAEFYKRNDGLAVGFSLEKVSNINSIKYAIDYTHDGGIAEHIEGTINNSNLDNKITREWFELGTCSSGGCAYFNGVEKLTLKIILTDIHSNTIEISKTL